MRHDGFRFPRHDVRIVLVDGVDRLLTTFKPAASAYTANTLEGRGVELRLGHMVRSVTSTYVELDKGDRIPTRTVVWAGGVTVEDTVASRLGAEAGANGRLVVDAHLGVVGRPGVYAVGDAAAVPWGPESGDAGRICPQLAQVAIQSGAHAARRDHQPDRGPTDPALPLPRQGHHGHHRPPGRHHRVPERTCWSRAPSGGCRGSACTSSTSSGFRNKLIVLVNWSWRYLSWGSGPRVIVDDDLELRDVGARRA